MRAHPSRQQLEVVDQVGFKAVLQVVLHVVNIIEQILLENASGAGKYHYGNLQASKLFLIFISKDYASIPKKLKRRVNTTVAVLPGGAHTCKSAPIARLLIIT